MKKRKILMIVITVSAFIFGLSLFYIDNKSDNTDARLAENKIQSKNGVQTNKTVWSEVPIKQYTAFSRCTGAIEFDLEQQISDTELIFSGEIINEKEYEVKWTDENNEQWGPFPSSVLKVKINKLYFGTGFEEEQVVRVYYPYSLSTKFEGTFSLKEKKEYIFMTKKLDEKFKEKRKKNASYDKFEQEKYADVYISEPYYSVMYVENSKVFMNSDYFCWDNQIINNGKDFTTKDKERV